MKGGFSMKEPNGKDILALLVSLLAKQEGVKIAFSIECGISEKGND